MELALVAIVFALAVLIFGRPAIAHAKDLADDSRHTVTIIDDLQHAYVGRMSMGELVISQGTLPQSARVAIEWRLQRGEWQCGDTLCIEGRRYTWAST